MVVELFTEDCAWCRVLERETFGSEGVEAALRDDVCVRYDADSPVGRPVAERFGVGSFPTTLFLDPAGEEIDRLVGYVPAQRFVDETARIRAGTRTLKALRVAHAAKPGDAALAVAFARKLARAGDLGAARLLLEPVVDATPPDESVLPAALVGLAAGGGHLPQTTLSVLVTVGILVGLMIEALSVRDAERGALMRMVQPAARPAGLPPRRGEAV